MPEPALFALTWGLAGLVGIVLSLVTLRRHPRRAALAIPGFACWVLGTGVSLLPKFGVHLGIASVIVVNLVDTAGTALIVIAFLMRPRTTRSPSPGAAPPPFAQPTQYGSPAPFGQPATPARPGPSVPFGRSGAPGVPPPPAPPGPPTDSYPDGGARP